MRAFETNRLYRLSVTASFDKYQTKFEPLIINLIHFKEQYITNFLIKNFLLTHFKLQKIHYRHIYGLVRLFNLNPTLYWHF
jgi:hypothetical protein